MPDFADLSVVLAGSAVTAAPALLGGVLRHGDVAVRVTEVEAYGGAEDPGSHASAGRTKRNQSMFGPPGTFYVYFTYGMHHCANVSCGPEDEPGAVLLRAGEVVEGVGVARARRPTARSDVELARGPARLCVALGIDLSHDGTDLKSGPVRLDLAGPVLSKRECGCIESGPRVGLRRAPQWPWRYWLRGEPTVSRYRPAAPRTGS